MREIEVEVDNSTISDQTLRDNTARFHEDKSLLKLIKVRDGNDVEQDVIQTSAISIQENVEENENNKEEIVDNINKKEDGETRIMRLRFEGILHTITAYTKENIEESGRSS